MFVLILGPDIRRAFTGPLVLKPEMPRGKLKHQLLVSFIAFYFFIKE